MEQPTPRRSSLFTPPAIDAAPTEPVVQADAGQGDAPAESVAPRPQRVRKAPGRAKEKQATLQVQLPMELWLAIKYEAMKRKTTASALVSRAMLAQFPAVAQAANRPAA
jgi:hypothetical protein